MDTWKEGVDDDKTKRVFIDRKKGSEVIRWEEKEKKEKRKGWCDSAQV